MSDAYTKVKKAIIPVAGLGTRMLPVTKAIPKELLPLVDKPLIQYIIDECIVSGITEIILVTHSSKNLIENYFNTNFELEMTLEKRVKYQLLKEIQSIYPSHVSIIYIHQRLAKGLGHAILCAYPIVYNKPVIIILPDIILDEYKSNLSQDNLSEMIKRFNKTGNSQIMVAPVTDVTAYGIVKFRGIEPQPGGKSIPIIGVIEKPKLNITPSNLSIVGRYVLSAGIWPMLKKTLPGIEGEIHLTDAINSLIKKETVEAYHIVGESYDCGNKLGYMQAFVTYGIYHNCLGKKFNSWLKRKISEIKDK